MPYIQVKLTASPDAALSDRIASEIVALTQAHLRKDPQVTAISVEYVDPRHWYAGGRSLAAQGKATFWLDVKVVDGSNTKTEMAAYLDAVYAFMAETLGDLHPESYILVHEVPASAYGYGGKTQEFRFVAGRMAAAA